MSETKMKRESTAPPFSLQLVSKISETPKATSPTVEEKLPFYSWLLQDFILHLFILVVDILEIWYYPKTPKPHLMKNSNRHV